MVHTSSDFPKRHTNGLLERITAIFASLAKGARRLKPKTKQGDEVWKIELRTPPPKSPLAKPKKLLNNISNKALPFVHDRKKHDEETESEADEWGDGGVWQKAILMGDKCQPLDFSGAIYYDSQGKQTNEIPLRSPRASPLPGYLTRRQEQNRPEIQA